MFRDESLKVEIPSLFSYDLRDGAFLRRLGNKIEIDPTKTKETYTINWYLNLSK